jgi:orotidine 5'-phosphate decarboxylase subfamily 2
MKLALAAAIRAAKNALCVGIDPHDAPDLESFSRAHVDAAAGIAPAVKFQSSFYEAHGSKGFATLEKMVRYAKDKGLFVILDAKRGDIASTMKAYGVMAFDAMGADALTVTPYMGLEVVEPLRPWLEKGRGIYAVWISSNPSGALVQDHAAAPLLGALEKEMTAWGVKDSLGLVLGATKLDYVKKLGLADRAADHSLLMPGVGAQGGEVTPDLRRLLQRGSSLVPISRALSQPIEPNWQNYTESLRSRIQAAAATLVP